MIDDKKVKGVAGTKCIRAYVSAPQDVQRGAALVYEKRRAIKIKEKRVPTPTSKTTRAPSRKTESSRDRSIIYAPASIQPKADRCKCRDVPVLQFSRSGTRALLIHFSLTHKNENPRRCLLLPTDRSTPAQAAMRKTKQNGKIGSASRCSSSSSSASRPTITGPGMGDRLRPLHQLFVNSARSTSSWASVRFLCP
jgi:hypothetical protein